VVQHLRGTGRDRHTTVPEHMPSSHRRYAARIIERILRDAAAIGPSMAKPAALILGYVTK
jgi:transposase